jgi:diguanylate cyclase (GGDEF)-like protein
LELTYRKKINLGFSLALLLVLLFSIYVFHITKKNHEVRELTKSTYNTISILNELDYKTKELEITKREYLLTRKSKYLDIYYVVMLDIIHKLEELEKNGNFLDDKLQKEKVSHVLNMLKEKINCSLDCEYDPKNKKPIHKILEKHILTIEEENYIQDVRNKIQEIEEQERFSLFERQDKEIYYSKILTFVVTIGSPFSVFIFLSLIYLINKDIKLERLHLVELKTLSMTDELTGLYNRRGFIHEAKKKLEEAYKENKKLYLYFIDMDGLKSINDTLGHEFGDMAIRDFSKILKQSFRLSDVIARLGGDEFAVIMVDEHVTPEMVTKRLQRKINEYNELNSMNVYKLSISLGLESFDPKNPITIEEMLRVADEKMYHQKKKSKGET